MHPNCHLQLFAQASIQSGSAADASKTATGASAMWSAAGLTSSTDMRAQLARDDAQASVRVSLNVYVIYNEGSIYVCM